MALSRLMKLHRIGQGHLRPGMNLARWQAILAGHNIGSSWTNVPDETLDHILNEIEGNYDHHPENEPGVHLLAGQQ